MERYFDAFVYVANWGTHQLMLRLSRAVLNPETAARYCKAEWAAVHEKGDFVILDFTLGEGEPEWVEGEED